MNYRLAGLLLGLSLFSTHLTQAQSSGDSPYHTSLKVDLPIAAAGTAAAYWGLLILNDKPGLTEAEARALRKEDVPRFDRFAAGYYDERANQLSNIPFYSAFALPVGLIALDPAIRQHHAGRAAVIYFETMAIAGAAFTQTAGRTFRARPLAYGADVPLRERTRRNTENSFFAGHTSSAAAAAFCAAKLFHDFHPDSRARPWVWTGAALVPATVGYFRLKAGKHFLTDNVLGYLVGAAIGIGVPQLHKMRAGREVGLLPVVMPNGTAGLAATWRLK